jgi:hypothetical protein
MTAHKTTYRPPGGGSSISGGGGGGGRGGGLIGGGASARAPSSGGGGLLGGGGASAHHSPSGGAPIRGAGAADYGAAPSPPSSPVIEAATLSALHLLLAPLPRGVAGRVVGSAGLVGWFALWGEAPGAALYPLAPMDLAASPDGSAWDAIGPLDYTWGYYGGAAPTFGVLGLSLDLSAGAVMAWCRGLREISTTAAQVRAQIAASDAVGTVHGATFPTIYAGLHLASAGPSGGLVAAAAGGTNTPVPNSWFGRSLSAAAGTNPLAPATSSSGGAITAAAFIEGSHVLFQARRRRANVANFDGGFAWQQDNQNSTLSATGPALGVASDTVRAVLGATPGNGTTPLTSVTFGRLFYQAAD